MAYDIGHKPTSEQIIKHIDRWKRDYFRRRITKRKNKIMLRCNCMAPQPVFWRYYIELWQDGKMLEQWQASPEFWDMAFRDEETWRRDLYPGLELLIYKPTETATGGEEKQPAQ